MNEGESTILFDFYNIIILFTKFSATFLDRLGIKGLLSDSVSLSLTIGLTVALALYYLN